MVVVIFEAMPSTGQYDRYLDIASDLKPLLEDVEGFISVERFSSLSETGKVLSLSFWQDEKAVTQWRKHVPHRKAQAEGRAAIFENYRIRVAEVVRDYGMKDRMEAPNDA